MVSVFFRHLDGCSELMTTMPAGARGGGELWLCAEASRRACECPG